jgi:hypothetical protein
VLLERKGRKQLAFCGAPPARRSMVLAELEQGRLLGFGNCLGAAGFDKVAPQEPPAIDFNEARERHDVRSSGWAA